MHITVEYTKEEYARAFWQNSNKRLNPWLDAAMALAAIAGGAWFVMVGEFLWGLLLLIPVALLGIMLYVVRYVVPGLVYKRLVAGRGPYTFTFTSEGVRFQARNIDSMLAWPLFTHAKWTEEHCLLYYGNNQFAIIPLRVFNSSGQREAFAALLKEKLPATL